MYFIDTYEFSLFQTQQKRSLFRNYRVFEL